MQALQALRKSLLLAPMFVLVMFRKRLRDVLRKMVASALGLVGGGAVRDRTWHDGDGAYEYGDYEYAVGTESASDHQDSTRSANTAQAI